MTSPVQAPAAAPAAATVRDLTFAYADRTALAALTLEVPTGAIFGLLGPNGSGKSTLLSLLAGLRQPAAGAISVFGEPPSAQLRARIGLLFQETSLDRLMTARETLWLHGRLFGITGRALAERIDTLLASVGLRERARSLVSTLSGGMKRRLELARLLLPGPELILLDEPTTGLDPDAEAAIWERLHEANRGGATIVLATNNVQEAERHCGVVALLHQGRLAAQGTPDELKAALKRDAVWLEWPDFPQRLAEEIAGWDGVGSLTWSRPTLHVTVDAASAFVPRLFQIAGEGIRSVRIRVTTLEDAYFDTVGASLSDPEGRE